MRLTCTNLGNVGKSGVQKSGSADLRREFHPRITYRKMQCKNCRIWGGDKF
jgi:hypothetical protein